MFEYETWLTLKGMVIYRDWFEFVTPAWLAFTVPIFAVFGPTQRASEILVTLFAVLGALGTYAAGRALFPRRTAIIAAWLWVLWSPCFRSNYLWINLVMVPFYLESLREMSLALDGKQSRFRLFACGLLCGILALIKQHGALTLVVAIGAWAGLSNTSLRRRLGGCALLVAGTVAVIVPVVGTLLLVVDPGTLVYDLVIYPLRDSAVTRWNEIPRLQLVLLAPLLALNLPLWIGRLFVKPKSFEQLKPLVLVVLWLGAAAANVLHSVRTELLISTLPFLALNASFSTCILLDSAARQGWREFWPRIKTWSIVQLGLELIPAASAVTLAAFVVGTVISSSYFLAWGRPTDHWVHTTLEPWDQAGHWIRAHTAPESRLFVFGAPAIYFGALRRPATPYINMEPSERNIRNLETEVIRYLASTPSSLVAYSPIPHVSFNKRTPDPSWQHSKRIESYILQHYRIVQELPGEVWLMSRMFESVNQ